MSIVDDRYASELITEKGRTYKFDDVLCMKQYLAEQKIAGATMLFVEDYLKQSAAPLNASQAVYLKHEMFTSPMNGNYAAFANAADARKLMDSLKVPALSWENLE
jgi:copper chaperone NosL